jgi:hypothetical protein
MGLSEVLSRRRIRSPAAAHSHVTPPLRAPLIGERAARRGRIATEGGDAQADVRQTSPFGLQPANRSDGPDGGHSTD